MFGQSSTFEQLLQRPKPSFLQRFLRAPCLVLAEALYRCRRTPQLQITNPVVTVCVSDTHNSQPQLPGGDLLIHAGDLTQSGSYEEMQAALSWVREQPFEHKVVVGGNHDLTLDTSRAATERESLQWGDITYLEHSSTVLNFANGRTLKIFGSPYSQKHGNWSFQYPRGLNVWSDVPDDIDVLVTHGPPKAHLDLTYGCEHLLQTLWRTRPKLHVFGHVHEGFGQEWLAFDVLQAAYENIIRAKGGLPNLFSVAWAFMHSQIWSPARSWDSRSPCLAVNAAMVGGLRDELRRRPAEVLI